MSMTAEQNRIIDIIANQLGVDKDIVTPGANIVDDLGADSLDVVERQPGGCSSVGHFKSRNLENG